MGELLSLRVRFCTVFVQERCVSVRMQSSMVRAAVQGFRSRQKNQMESVA
jgi:hypothetical protein